MISTLFRASGALIFLLSLSFYSLYPLSLLGINLLADASLLSYYAFATFGAAGTCWAWLLYSAQGIAQDKKSQQSLLAAPSAIGFALLALMRLFTLINIEGVFPFLPTSLGTLIVIGESLLFGVLAIAFFWAHRTLQELKSTL